jgi:hypothetical protein
MFDLIYADDFPEEPNEGEMVEDWGMYHKRPFHIVSALKTGRYLDFLGRNLVIKRPNGRPSQLFWFDYKSRTIKSW